MAKIGVYMIKSKKFPSRIYVGSTFSLNTRRLRHWKLLSENSHHSPKLQNHYNKYGEEDLEFSIIELFDNATDGEFIKEWDSIADAARFYGVRDSNIYGCCKHRYGRRTTAGFIWEYKNKEN